MLSVECILSNPTPEQFDEFWRNGLSSLEAVLPRLLNATSDIRKIVLRYEDGTLLPSFAVRKDFVPLEVDFNDPADNVTDELL